MASTINASTSPAAIVQTADGTGILSLQTGNTTALTIDASQNVCIGNTPTAAYALVKNFQVGQVQYIFANNSNAGGGFLGNAYLDATATMKYATTNAATYYNNQGGVHTWSYAASGTAGNTVTFTEAMRINSSGALLINRTTQLNSERFAITGNSSSQCMALISPTSAGYDMCNINNSNGQVGLISTSGSSTTYATSSDYRLKEDIVPMVGALNTVAALKPVTYKWKVDGSDGQGFIAHELQEVVPQAVTGEKDAVDEDGNIKPQGVDTSFLVATLTAAIQEQQALITSLTARITALEGA